MSYAPESFDEEPREAPIAGEAAEEPVAAEALRRPIDAIRAELTALRNKKTSWTQAVVTLVASLAVFVALGLFNQPVVDLVLLVGVLFLHELGHYLAMRVFEYHNVRMFFIPLFGAAVSGKKTGVEGYKEAIVVLMGPVPGLVFGLALLAVWVATDDPIYRTPASLLVIINGFNLLPVFPLDGGRFLQVTLFSRNRYLETIVQGLAGLALVAIAILLKAWVLGLLGGFVLVGCQATWKTSKIAAALRPRWAGAAAGEADEMPDLLLAETAAGVCREFPQQKQPNVVARLVSSVWDKLQARPPDVGQTIVLLFVYGFFLAATFVVPLVLLIVREVMARA
ncbi:MAG: hypothetical protein JW809_16790 [Pirellulales bacterium]|nr:hypothetical protein [Pirellulales bacterium]